MARVGFFCDLHGNLPALDAVLGALHDAGCDRIVFGGDAVGIGSQPRECVERLLDEPGLVVVRGNHDDYASCGLPAELPPWIAAAGPEYHEWMANQLPTELRGVVATWPRVASVALGGARVAVAHYALAPDGRGLSNALEVQPDGARLDELFASIAPADAVVYGHTHVTHVARGRTRYVNPGAAGCGDRPVARYAVLECGEGAADVDVRLADVPYDGTALVAAFESRDLEADAVARRVFFPWSLPG